MKIKLAILAAALGLASMSFATTRTYKLVLNTSATAGNMQLAAGSYRLKLDGRIATFTNLNTNQSVMVVVKVNSSSMPFEHTAIELKNDNGRQKLESIELEDSNNSLAF